MEFISYAEPIRREPKGDELEQLSTQLKNLRKYLEQFDGEQTLYVCGKEGYPVYGAIQKHEVEPIRKRFRAEIEKRIESVTAEIRKKI